MNNDYCVLLDADDTIFDFHKCECIAIEKTFRGFGIPTDAAVIARYSEINQQCWEKLELKQMTRDEVLCRRFEILFEEIGVQGSGFETQKIYETNLSREYWLIPGALEMLERMKDRYRLFIVSNGTTFVQDSRIALSGIARYFEKIFISERVGADKPSQTFFERAFASIEGFRKDRAIIIGDSLTSDIRGGINAGIKTCLFNTRHVKPIPGVEPDYIIESLAEVEPLVDSLQ